MGEGGWSSASVWNTDYVRLKSLVIGYTIPEKITRKIKIERFRIFFEGTNLLTFSEFTRNWGLDPEDVPVKDAWNGLAGTNSNATRHIHVPQLKTFNIGISIQL
jgi:hypothetical protein